MIEAQQADRIRLEHQKVEELADGLREVVSVVPRVIHAAWLDTVKDRFEHFRAHLHRHLAMEEQGGYMSAVTERIPRLTGRVERLQQEHRSFGTLFDGLRPALAELTTDDPLLARDCCKRISALLDYVDHHETEENELLEIAYTCDIGTKD